MGGAIVSTGSIAYLTKPINESFATQTTMDHDVLTKVLTTEFINYYAKFDDYVFFKVVTYPTGEKDRLGKSYGFFNGWYDYHSGNE